jgi:phage tail-like protein
VASGTIERPHLSAHFRLSIVGLALASFSECAGLAAELGVEEYPEGGENRFTHRFPARHGSPNLVLSRGIAASSALWDWYAESLETGRVAPRSGQVELLSWIDGELAPARVWTFQRAYPVKITGPTLNALSSAIAIESLELAHHGLGLVPLSNA